MGKTSCFLRANRNICYILIIRRFLSEINLFLFFFPHFLSFSVQQFLKAKGQKRTKYPKN